MIIFILVLLNSLNTVNSIRDLLANNQHKAAYISANSIIIQQGTIDADNILFFLRGYANVKLKNYKQGISDLTRYLITEKNINPKDKIQSYKLRCLAYLRTGNLNEALIDANKSKDDSLIKLVTKASLLYNTAISNESSPRYSLNKYVELIKICPLSEDFLLEAAKTALLIDNNTLFIELTQKVLKISPKDGKLFEMLGLYYFSQYELSISKKYIKKCINSYSESSKCSAILKSINNFEESEKKVSILISKKDFEHAEEQIKICQSIVKKFSKENSPLNNQFKKMYVKILIQKDQKEEAIECLNGLTKAFPENNEFFIQRGKLLLYFGDYSGAISDFQIVKKRTKVNSTENQEVVKLIEKVSQMQENDKNMNYYKILGLKNGANISEVKKAYKKLVIKWHSDRFTEPLKKKVAEKKMMMINMAYDTLSDETKKKVYDFDLRSKPEMNENEKQTNSKRNGYKYNNNNKKSNSNGFNNNNNNNNKKSNNKDYNENNFSYNNKKFNSNDKNNYNNKNSKKNNDGFNHNNKKSNNKDNDNNNKHDYNNINQKPNFNNKNSNNTKNSNNNDYNNGFRYTKKRIYNSNKNENDFHRNKNNKNASDANSGQNKYGYTNRNIQNKFTKSSNFYNNEYKSEYNFNDGYRNTQRKRRNTQNNYDQNGKYDRSNKHQKFRNNNNEL